MPSTTKSTRAKKPIAAKPMTVRDELVAAGRKALAKEATNKDAGAPVDPEAVLADIRSTIVRMDDAMAKLSDAADQAQVQTAIAMGATQEQVDEMRSRMTMKAAAKRALRDGQPPPAPPPAAATTAPSQPKRGWKAPQDPQTRSKALQAGAPQAPDGLMRCWHCFPDLPPASHFDWLGRGQPGEKDRPGQPLKRFLQPGPHRNFPTRQRSKIYLCPLGDVSGAPPANLFAELLRRWFLLEVVVMKPPSAAQLDALERDERGCGYGRQIECPSAHELLQVRT